MQAARKRKYRDARKEAVAQTNFRKNLAFIVAENAKGTNPYVLASFSTLVTAGVSFGTITCLQLVRELGWGAVLCLHPGPTPGACQMLKRLEALPMAWTVCCRASRTSRT